MAVAASVKRSWNSAACGCRSERAQRSQIQSKSYRGTTSCEWVETQKYVSKTLRTEFVRGATYSYSYSWMWGECEKWNENEHWAWISLTFGYGGVCCKAENRNKNKINKKKKSNRRKRYTTKERQLWVKNGRIRMNIHDVENIKLFLEYIRVYWTTLHWKSYEYFQVNNTTK